MSHSVFSLIGIWDLTGLVALILILYVAKFYFQYFTRSNPLPGPLPLPIFGNRLQYRGHPATWAQKLRERYGDMCEIYMGSERHVWLSRSELVSKIFSPSTNNNFLVRITAREGLDEIGVTTRGLTFNRNVESWMYNRKFFNQAISVPKFLKQTVEKTQELFAEMESYWSELGHNTTLNFSEWIDQYIMDISFVMITNKRAYSFVNYYNRISKGKSVKYPDSVLIESEKFIKNVHSWLSALQFFMDTPKFWRNHVTNMKKRANWLKAEVNRLNQTLLDIIRDRRQEISRTPPDVSLKSDFLTMLLTINTPRDITINIADDHHTNPMTDEDVCGNLIEAVVAGVDTTASTFCFIIYHLAHYPEVKERVFREINSVFGDLNRPINYEDLSKLNYCEAVIKEVSRLMSIVPAIWRMAIRDDKISHHQFKGSTQFMVNTYAIHRHEADWKDPELFNPSRFMNDSNNSATRIHKNSLLIFGNGLRMCPGKQFAMTEIKTLMILLYRKYDVELVDMDAPIKYHYSTVKHCDDLYVRIKPRI
ncbi:cytochrome P450 [Gigaspora rosea]|uniref:Cytochrome P450 n=1 Tax=Gigaspora rosea TaxID=44941 RepID=A0A397UBS5_9GLOM|nr:cytochrome P450 [Gigaspora rosea]